MASGLLIHGSTLGSATMRHEVPARVLDPFLYGEADGRRFAVLPVIDAPNVPPGIDPFAITSAVVPREFPLFVAEALRAAGVALTVDGPFFAGMATAASLLARCDADDGLLIIEGEVVTSERVAGEIRSVAASMDCRLDDLIGRRGAGCGWA